MGRQLFLHHYLPAHLASALVTGALVEFIFNIEPATFEEVANNNANVTNSDKNKKGYSAGTSRPVRERIASQNLLGTWAAVVAILTIVIGSFIYFAPLTYGSPGLEVDQVNARKWLNYDLHFAK